MIIPNHKTIYRNVAEKYGIDHNLVEQIGQYTWEDLNKRIAGFENREIYMLKLGVFKFRKIKGENYLQQLKKSPAMISENPVLSEEQREEALINTLNKISAIENLVNEWEEILKERKEFKNEQSNRNIQKQGSDLGGTQEQNVQEGPC